ncbi:MULTISPECIES: glycosyltransferase family 2 protein [unclassified Tolypothrix]|uniref:glycosyltransferase family 2 protein n=1 Tax=unclassified Tolypothrix TaxID=2649714 RepID=UPI0005EABD50|nr:MULTISPECIES: glycosyltransferase [unclassified Tolypothrix]BAY88792.1 putative glycosyl transferase [Microchaete diplosiphon NIES-3275]EKF02809.1 putative family 2 glycosyltransferase [Tolypothrix sp. PCC 7601]MBE9083687.1 glycosyltransferase [Tolypothrix sp. LEGE 11397]UYD29447.1 glycosyltransferase [Tolypothrix sp. PCC 7712]UYD34644.1 glycosyltransferase [Tolypothrix sp. PCC 7601]
MNLPDIPQVTIVVVPRERFSYTQESLTSVWEHTTYPFKLIYVDVNSPAHIRDYLAEQAAQKQFQLIRTEKYLSPNCARNLGLREVSSKYVVFLDNDVVVTPGWLEALIECAETTEATIVGPLTCQGTPVHEEVHCAGGETGVREETKGETTRRRIIEKIYLQGKRVVDVQPQLKREETGLAEFHCVLIRTEIFQQIGFLDEELLSTKEHVDLCMLVNAAGGTIYLEPESIVTYVPGPPLEWTDLHYYMLRWSDRWEFSSLKHLLQKWNLSEDEYFQNRYKRLGSRRHMTIVHPFARKFPVGNFGFRVVSKILRLLDRVLNRWITTW